MAIEINDSSVKVVKERELYMGLCDMNIVAINPDKAQLINMGFKPKDAPKYQGTSDNGDYTIVRVYAEAPKARTGMDSDIRVNFNLYIRPEHWQNKAGDKYQFIDKHGKTGWAPDGSESRLEWIDSGSARKSYKGEETLISFLKAWANTGPDGICNLDEPSALSMGDFTEVQEYVPLLEKNSVKLLLGVTVDEESGKVYSRVYTKYFGRLTSSIFGFQDSLSGDYGEFKAIYPRDLSLQLYEGQGMDVQPDEAGAKEAPTNSLFS